MAEFKGAFSYVPESSIRKVEPKHRDTIDTVIGGEMIKRALNKYGFMNLALVKEFLNSTGRGRIKAEKTLSGLLEMGDIDKYVISRGEDFPDISVFTLSDAMAEEAEEKNKSRAQYRRRFDNEAIPYILERLSMAEFHIGAISNPKSTEQWYNHPLFLKNGRPFVMPSAIRYKNFLSHTILFAADVLPKGGSSKDTAVFLEKMLMYKEYFEENTDKYRTVIYVVVCDTDEQIREYAHLTNRMADIKDMFTLYYKIPRFSPEKGADPLKRLYKCEWTYDTADMSLVKLK